MEADAAATGDRVDITVASVRAASRRPAEWAMRPSEPSHHRVTEGVKIGRTFFEFLAH